MSHWRKRNPPASQFNASLVGMVDRILCFYRSTCGALIAWARWTPLTKSPLDSPVRPRGFVLMPSWSAVDGLTASAPGEARFSQSSPARSAT